MSTLGITVLALVALWIGCAMGLFVAALCASAGECSRQEEALEVARLRREHAREVAKDEARLLADYQAREADALRLGRTA